MKIEGKVIEGDKRGRKIGFPTANIDVICENLKYGVYGVEVFVLGNKYYGLMNVGFRPTFKDVKKKSFEVHILKFDKDIYEEEIGVEVLFFIRDEIKFSGVDELKIQIEKDIEFFYKNI